MHASRIRLECLKLAVEMCKTASAFDRPERVMELTKQFESYCYGGPQVSTIEKQVLDTVFDNSDQKLVDPGRQMPGDPPPDPPTRKPLKKDMAKYLA